MFLSISAPYNIFRYRYRLCLLIQRLVFSRLSARYCAREIDPRVGVSRGFSRIDAFSALMSSVRVTR